MVGCFKNGQLAHCETCLNCWLCYLFVIMPFHWHFFFKDASMQVNKHLGTCPQWTSGFLQSREVVAEGEVQCTVQIHPIKHHLLMWMGNIKTELTWKHPCADKNAQKHAQKYHSGRINTHNNREELAAHSVKAMPHVSFCLKGSRYGPQYQKDWMHSQHFLLLFPGALEMQILLNFSKVATKCVSLGDLISGVQNLAAGFHCSWQKQRVCSTFKCLCWYHWEWEELPCAFIAHNASPKVWLSLSHCLFTVLNSTLQCL